MSTEKENNFENPLKPGVRLQIITKSLIRYVGTLLSVDLLNSNLALIDVRIYGTEDRDTTKFIPPQEFEEAHILFRGESIKDLQVKDRDDLEAHQSSFELSDPAIIVMSSKKSPVANNHSSYGNNICSEEKLFKSSNHQHRNSFQNFFQQTTPTVVGGVDKEKESPQPTWNNQSNQNKWKERFTNYDKRVYNDDGRDYHSFRHSVPSGYSPRNFNHYDGNYYKALVFKNSPAPKRNNNRDQFYSEFGTQTSPRQFSNFNLLNNTTFGANNSAQQRRKSFGQRVSFSENGGGHHEFNFDLANSKFKKFSTCDNTTDPSSPNATANGNPSGFYDKTKSFFDTIGRVMDAKKERADRGYLFHQLLNKETFGYFAVRAGLQSVGKGKYVSNRY